MNNVLNGAAARERELVELYRDLTGVSEAAARNVFMYVCGGEAEKNGIEEGADTDTLLREEFPAASFARGAGEMSSWLRQALPVPAHS